MRIPHALAQFVKMGITQASFSEASRRGEKFAAESNDDFDRQIKNQIFLIDNLSILFVVYESTALNVFKGF